MSYHRPISMLCLLLLLLGSQFVSTARAQGDDPPCQWTGEKNSNWGDTENWEDCDEGIPTSDKDANVGGGSNVPVINGGGVARNITLEGQLIIASGPLFADSITTEIGGGGHISNQGRVEAPITVLGSMIVGGGGTFEGDITVAPFSTLLVSTGGGGGGTSFNVLADITNSGTISTEGNNAIIFNGNQFTNHGTVNGTVRFPDVGRVQQILGAGTWEAPGQIFLGSDARVALGESVAVNGAQVRVTNGSRLDIGDNDLTLDGAAFFYVDLDASIAGSGTIKSLGATTFSHDGIITPTLEIESGTASGGGSGRFTGPITIHQDAILEVAEAGVINALANVTNEGTIASANGTFVFKGPALNNNGTVTSNVLFERQGPQTLQGSGVFTETSQAFINRPTVLRLGSNHQMNQITVRVGGALDITSRTLSIQGPNQGANSPLLITPGAFFTSTNSTVIFNGRTEQTVASYIATYHNLTANNAQPVTAEPPVWPLIVRGTLRAEKGSLTIDDCDCHAVQIDNGATLNVTEGNQVTVSGNWTNNGTFTAATGTTVVFDGSSAQRLAGSSASTFRHLSIQNTAGVDLEQNAEARDRLSLDHDIRASGSNTLTLQPATTTTGNGDVWGRVRRTGPLAAGTTYSFGNPNTNLTFASTGTRPTEVIVHLRKELPGYFAAGVQRTYQISTTGGSGFTTDLRLHYRDEEVAAAGLTEKQVLPWKQQSGQQSWRLQPVGSRNEQANWVEVSGVDPRGTWALARNFEMFIPLISR